MLHTKCSAPVVHLSVYVAAVGALPRLAVVHDVGEQVVPRRKWLPGLPCSSQSLRLSDAIGNSLAVNAASCNALGAITKYAAILSCSSMLRTVRHRHNVLQQQVLHWEVDDGRVLLYLQTQPSPLPTSCEEVLWTTR